MADKQAQAMGRLLKKLSALRVTLRKDERDLLGQFVLGASIEVAGHAVTAAKTAKAVGKAAKAAGRGMEAGRSAEVAGHAVTAAKAARAAGRQTIVLDAARKVYRLQE